MPQKARHACCWSIALHPATWPVTACVTSFYLVHPSTDNSAAGPATLESPAARMSYLKVLVSLVLFLNDFLLSLHLYHMRSPESARQSTFQQLSLSLESRDICHFPGAIEVPSRSAPEAWLWNQMLQYQSQPGPCQAADFGAAALQIHLPMT